MKTLIGIIVVIVIAIAGFVAISLLFPHTAQAPATTNTATSTNTDTVSVEIVDVISVSSPTTGQTVASPVTITGTARGTWYFEASFPIEVFDESGTSIGQGHGEAQGDWMTEDFVPFKALVTFTSPGAGKTGIIRLKNDNPSGDPARDKYLDIPVVF